MGEACSITGRGGTVDGGRGLVVDAATAIAVGAGASLVEAGGTTGTGADAFTHRQASLLLALVAFAYAEDALPPIPDGVNRDRVAAFQAALMANDYAGASAAQRQINDEKAAIPKSASKADKDKAKAALDAESEYLREWRKAYQIARQRANQQAVADQEAANKKAADDTQKKAEHDKIDAANKSEKIQQDGGFSDKDLNISVAKFRKELSAFNDENDIDLGLSQLNDLTFNLINLQRWVWKLETATDKDFAAYNKVRDEYTAAIAAKTNASGIKGKRYTGATKGILSEFFSREALANTELVVRIIETNIIAYGKYVQEIKEVPTSTKELTEGYAACKWNVPFRHEPIPQGQNEIVLLKVKGDNIPAIISNPILCGGRLLVGSLDKPQVGVASGIKYNIRMVDAPAAKAVWEQAVKLSITGGTTDEKSWPQEISSTITKAGTFLAFQAEEQARGLIRTGNLVAADTILSNFHNNGLSFDGEKYYVQIQACKSSHEMLMYVGGLPDVEYQELATAGTIPITPHFTDADLDACFRRGVAANVNKVADWRKLGKQFIATQARRQQLQEQKDAAANADPTDDNKLKAISDEARKNAGNTVQADAAYNAMYAVGKNLRSKGAPRSDLETMIENLRRQGAGASTDQQRAIITLQIKGAMEGWNAGR